MTLLHKHHPLLQLHVCCTCVTGFSDPPAYLCVFVRNCMPVEGNTGNGLISELAQAPHYWAVTTFNYHKHQHTQKILTSICMCKCTRCQIQYPSMRIRSSFLTFLSPFPFIHFLCLSLSLVITALSRTGLWSSHTAVGSWTCSIQFPTVGPMLRTDFFVEPLWLLCSEHQCSRQCFERCFCMSHQACSLPPNPT